MLDILSVGNANIDIYPSGKKFPGGSANNFAVDSSKLGLKSGFLGFVGNDENGAFLINNLKANKVKSFIKIAEEKTGTVKILSRGFNKKFIKFLGANNNLKTLDLKPYLKIAGHVHLATPPIELLKQLPKGLSVSVDPGSKLSEHSISELKKYLANVRVFFATEAEAKNITEKSYKLAAEELVKAGVKIAVIKRESVGVHIKSRDGEFDLDYLKGEVVDATGGGDAFASAFIHGLVKSKNLKECAIMGLASSAYKIGKMGAQSAPDFKELESELEFSL